MSISMRSTKPQMYSEIERLRALIDQRDLRITSLEEKVRNREAKIEELSASRPAPQPSAAPLSDRSARNLMMKRLAITCRATVKWDDDQGFLQYKAGNWVAVPAHLVRYVTERTAA